MYELNEKNSLKFYKFYASSKKNTSKVSLKPATFVHYHDCINGSFIFKTDSMNCCSRRNNIVYSPYNDATCYHRSLSCVLSTPAVAKNGKVFLIYDRFK